MTQLKSDASKHAEACALGLTPPAAAALAVEAAVVLAVLPAVPVLVACVGV